MDGLTDELLDAKERIADLDCKLLEYEDVIDALNHQFEQQEEEYNDMLSFMEQCCMDEVKRVAPKFIAKHYVLNKDGKGIQCLFIALLLHYSDYALFLLC